MFLGAFYLLLAKLIKERVTKQHKYQQHIFCQPDCSLSKKVAFGI